MKEIKKIFARQLRRWSTETERKIWEALRDRKFLGLKFRRQHVIEGFTVDFFCHKLKLAVEADGKIHDNRKGYDAERQAVLEAESVAFIRVTNEEVDRDINILLDRIKRIRDSFYDR